MLKYYCHNSISMSYNSTSMSNLNEIRKFYQGLETLYQTYLPKVDPNLVNDLLSRQHQLKQNDSAPFYMVEIFTKGGIDDEKKREYIIRKTGMAASIHDNGTHYVTNHRLTLELLNELSEPEDVVGITGNLSDVLYSKIAFIRRILIIFLFI